MWVNILHAWTVNFMNKVVKNPKHITAITSPSKLTHPHYNYQVFWHSWLLGYWCKWSMMEYFQLQETGLPRKRRDFAKEATGGIRTWSLWNALSIWPQFTCKALYIDCQSTKQPPSRNFWLKLYYSHQTMLVTMVTASIYVYTLAPAYDNYFKMLSARLPHTKMCFCVGYLFSTLVFKLLFVYGFCLWRKEELNALLRGIEPFFSM